MSLSIRARLTVWYTAVLTIVLALAAVLLYLFHSRSRMRVVDGELARTRALAVRVVRAELGEGAQLGEAARDALEHLAVPGRSLAIFDRAGVLVFGDWDDLAPPGPTAGRAPRDAFTADAGGGRARILLARHQDQGAEYVVAVAERLAPLERERAFLGRALLGSVLLALLLAAAGGFWIARAALGPVTAMADQARLITAEAGGLRLSAANPGDELGRLAAAFNDLLRRREAALSQQRQFMADASHELRTPVSVARTAIEVAQRSRERRDGGYDDAFRVVAEQMRRLSRLVDDLFMLARADASGLGLQPEPLYVEELVAECVKEACILAAERRVSVDWNGTEEVEIEGDERLLRRMMMNLLHNAVRHTPDGGATHVTIDADAEGAQVEVIDGGPGIPESERERIFQRFVQLDPARTGDGAGLGLPIARAIAEAHAGSLVLARTGPAGSAFRVRLPRRSR